MKKLITSLFLSSLVLVSFGQVTELWNFSVQNANLGTAVDDVRNGIAVSPDGTQLYLSARTADANQVAIYNTVDGTRTGYLPALAGFASNYGGSVAVDSNGAIYASNVIIGASELKVAKWDNATATPTLFISTTAHDGSNGNRIGYGMDVFVDENGDGFLLMHKNGTKDIKYWQITNNVPVSQDPSTIVLDEAYTDAYARIAIVDKDHFWIDGNATRPAYCTITRGAGDYSVPTAISNTGLGWTADMSIGVGGATEFNLNGFRYGVFAANNHGVGFNGGHYSILRELSTGVTTVGAIIADIPTAGLGRTTDASHFVKSVVRVDGDDAYIYSVGGFNGVAAVKVEAVKTPVFTPAAGKHDASSLIVEISSATEGAEIRYTTDGTTPTSESTLYVDGITLPGGTGSEAAITTVKVLATKAGLLSTLTEGVFEILPGIFVGLNNAKVNFKIAQTASGIAVQLDRQSTIELYSISGQLIESTNATGMYSRDLNKGMYIIRVNGQAQKFVK